ncbi:hypothetical protein ANAPC5_01228 [Anaplasma phagocytophilum]|nr:hypothetical protein ANAPC5_01228 [Anaplasma phagocytophilum]
MIVWLDDSVFTAVPVYFDRKYVLHVSRNGCCGVRENFHLAISCLTKICPRPKPPSSVRRKRLYLRMGSYDEFQINIAKILLNLLTVSLEQCMTCRMYVNFDKKKYIENGDFA